MQTNIAQSFKKFLDSFLPELAKKSTQVNKLTWILETTGSSDAADVKGELDAELRLLLSDSSLYQELLTWENRLEDPLQKRQWNVLMRLMKQYQIPKTLVEEIAKKEAALALLYATFRPTFQGKPTSENALRSLLKQENDVSLRKEAWASSKQIGALLAPHIMSLVKLRNQAARQLGYADFFQMQLELQEVDREWLLSLFEDVAKRSEWAYQEILTEVAKAQAVRFQVPIKELGPWSWSDPFCQEDPLDLSSLDDLVQGVDLVSVTTLFYEKMGIDVRPILKRSDLFEKEGKNQHAFCIHIDRDGDIRTLNNVTQSIKWLETLLHEYGHAIYEEGIDPKLPWLLREPPQMMTTEAMALLAGRQAYLSDTLEILVGKSSLIAEKSLQRRQLIFSRWALCMTAFESALYQNPEQDLNRLWKECVEKYQKIPSSLEKEHWAVKYHIGLAPVYYFSYLLGELFASAIQKILLKATGSSHIATKKAGDFLREKLFFPGNTMRWDELVRHATGSCLTPDAWLEEFCEKEKI